MSEAVRDSRRPSADLAAARARVAGFAFGIAPAGCGSAADSAITGGPTRVPRPPSRSAEWDG